MHTLTFNVFKNIYYHYYCINAHGRGKIRTPLGGSYTAKINTIIFFYQENPRVFYDEHRTCKLGLTVANPRFRVYTAFKMLLKYFQKIKINVLKRF